MIVDVAFEYCTKRSAAYIHHIALKWLKCILTITLSLVPSAGFTALNETGASVIQLDSVRDRLGCITERMSLNLLYVI